MSIAVLTNSRSVRATGIAAAFALALTIVPVQSVQANPLRGGLLGALGGGVIGGLLGGGRGAVAGAVVGGIAGTAVGAAKQHRKRKAYQRYLNSRRAQHRRRRR